RLQETNALLKKNTISLLTHALLYLDVLTFKQWQTDPGAAKQYYKQLETTVLTGCFFSLKSKRKKTKYDKLLIELFETSPEYIIDGSENGAARFLESISFLNDKGYSLEKQ